MSASDVIASNKAPKNASVNVTENKNSVNIEMKTYTLKEVDALRKKGKLFNIDPIINVVDESSTGSCISVELKTSMDLGYERNRWY